MKIKERMDFSKLMRKLYAQNLQSNLLKYFSSNTNI